MKIVSTNMFLYIKYIFDKKPKMCVNILFFYNNINDYTKYAI